MRLNLTPYTIDRASSSHILLEIQIPQSKIKIPYMRNNSLLISNNYYQIVSI